MVLTHTIKAMVGITLQFKDSQTEEVKPSPMF